MPTNELPRKPGRGCLFYGGIAFGIISLVVVLMAYMGYRYAKNLVDQFTDTQPMALPAVRLSEAEISRLRQRISVFSEAVDKGTAPAPLTVTADEVNALLATDPGLGGLKGHAYVTLTDSNVQAQVSLPAGEFGFRPLRGRYINASGALTVAIKDGRLFVNISSLSAKGKPLPENFMRHIRPQNFAQKLDEDPNSQLALSKLQEIQIHEGSVTIVPKSSR